MQEPIHEYVRTTNRNTIFYFLKVAKMTYEPMLMHKNASAKKITAIKRNYNTEDKKL